MQRDTATCLLFFNTVTHAHKATRTSRKRRLNGQRLHLDRYRGRIKERYTRAARSYRSRGSYSLAFHARRKSPRGCRRGRGRRMGMRRVGEESTRGVRIPGESVPCSPRLHGFSARNLSASLKKIWWLFLFFSFFSFVTREYNELDDVSCLRR